MEESFRQRYGFNTMEALEIAWAPGLHLGVQGFASGASPGPGHARGRLWRYRFMPVSPPGCSSGAGANATMVQQAQILVSRIKGSGLRLMPIRLAAPRARSGTASILENLVAGLEGDSGDCCRKAQEWPPEPCGFVPHVYGCQ